MRINKIVKLLFSFFVLFFLEIMVVNAETNREKFDEFCIYAKTANSKVSPEENDRQKFGSGWWFGAEGWGFEEYRKDVEEWIRIGVTKTKAEIHSNAVRGMPMSKYGIVYKDINYIDVGKFWDNNGDLDCGKTISVLYKCDESCLIANMHGTGVSNNIYSKIGIDVYETALTKEEIEKKYGNKYWKEEIWYFSSKTSGNEAKEVTTCDKIFGAQFGKIITDTISFIRFLVPVIIILMTILDFLKAVASQDPDKMKKAGSNLAKRLVVGISIFLVATVINLLLGLAIDGDVCSRYIR